MLNDNNKSWSSKRFYPFGRPFSSTDFTMAGIICLQAIESLLSKVVILFKYLTEADEYALVPVPVQTTLY